jgi:hypothetical protein
MIPIIATTSSNGESVTMNDSLRKNWSRTFVVLFQYRSHLGPKLNNILSITMGPFWPCLFSKLLYLSSRAHVNCAVVRLDSPLAIKPSSSNEIFSPSLERRYAVVNPAMPPPIIVTSVIMSLDNLQKPNPFSITLNHDGMVKPEV